MGRRRADLVGHEGGNAVGDHACTLTGTDIATAWTENRSVPDKARTWAMSDTDPGPWVERGLSAPRYAVYLAAAAGRRAVALEICEWNVAISAATTSSTWCQA